MQMKLLGKGKTKVRIEVEEEPPLLNALREELANDDDVKSATYDKGHPKTDNPVLIVETDGEAPLKVVKRAVRNLGTSFTEFREEFESAA